MKGLMLMSGKSRIVFYAALAKFWTYFQNIGLFLSERGYLNPRKQAFKKWDCVCVCRRYVSKYIPSEMPFFMVQLNIDMKL